MDVDYTSEITQEALRDVSDMRRKLDHNYDNVVDNLLLMLKLALIESTGGRLKTDGTGNQDKEIIYSMIVQIEKNIGLAKVHHERFELINELKNINTLR